MPKPVKYGDTIFESEGTLVNHLMKNECRSVEVWVIPGTKGKILQFRVCQKDRDLFIPTTEYRVKKYLTDSQKENIALFKSVKHDLNQDNFRNFGAFLDRYREMEKQYETDMRLKTMIDNVKSQYGSVEL